MANLSDATTIKNESTAGANTANRIGTLLETIVNELNANTAKVGITTAQANAIVANTAKVGITTAQADAIAANTAKVGITTAQADAITANTAKVSYTDAAAVAANTAKVGITTAQADAIAANTAKVGYTDAAVLAYIRANMIPSDINDLGSANGSVNWVGNESNLYKITLAGNSTLENPSAPQTGIYQFIIQQDSGGLNTLSFGSIFKFPGGNAPSVTLDGDAKDLITCLYDGTDLLVVDVLNFL